MGLTAEEVSSFRRDGYLLVHRPVFGPAELDELNAIYEEHRAAAPTKRGDEFDTPHFEDQRLLRFLLDDRVLDLVEGLLGPKIILWSSHFIGKEPLTGRATPWHRDSDYWNGRLDRFDQIVTVWLALDDVDRDNGCMRVLAGSHWPGKAPRTGLSTARPILSRRRLWDWTNPTRWLSNCAAASVLCTTDASPMVPTPTPATGGGSATRCAICPARPPSCQGGPTTSGGWRETATCRGA